MDDNFSIKNIINPSLFGEDYFLEHLIDLGVTTKNIEVISNHIKNQEKRITLLVSTPFLESNDLVIKFLNTGHKKSIALKGLPGVFEEFYFDGHPKAIGISEEYLERVSIVTPNSGFIDSEKLGYEKLEETKSKIMRLKKYLRKNIMSNIKCLEEFKFYTLKHNMKQQINDLTIYANAHIFDLVIIDKNNQKHIIPTFKCSPVISEKVQIVVLGPETIKKWKEVLDNTDLLITYGDIKLYKDILSENDRLKIITIPRN